MGAMIKLCRGRTGLSASAIFATTVIACEDASTVVGSFFPEAEGGAPSTSGGASSSGGADATGGDGGRTAGGASPWGLEFEAEDGLLNDGFAVSTSGSDSSVTAITATMPAGMADAPGEARAIYQFEVPNSANYVIYGRIHSPGAATNRFWFRVDEGDWTLWRISTGEEWYWDSLHENVDYGNPIVFPFEAGTHRLELGNAVMGAELDRFYITESTAEAPENPGLSCNPPHSIQLEGECVRSCGSYQTVSCGVEACAGKQEVAAYDCAICCLL